MRALRPRADGNRTQAVAVGQVRQCPRTQKLGATAAPSPSSNTSPSPAHAGGCSHIIASLNCRRRPPIGWSTGSSCQGYLSRRAGAAAPDHSAPSSLIWPSAHCHPRCATTPRMSCCSVWCIRSTRPAISHAAQWRGGLSRPRRGRGLAAAAALHLGLACAAALQRHRQTLSGAVASRAAAVC